MTDVKIDVNQCRWYKILAYPYNWIMANPTEIELQYQCALNKGHDSGEEPIDHSLESVDE